MVEGGGGSEGGQGVEGGIKDEGMGRATAGGLIRKEGVMRKEGRGRGAEGRRGRRKGTGRGAGTTREGRKREGRSRRPNAGEQAPERKGSDVPCVMRREGKEDSGPSSTTPSLIGGNDSDGLVGFSFFPLRPTLSIASPSL